MGSDLEGARRSGWPPWAKLLLLASILAAASGGCCLLVFVFVTPMVLVQLDAARRDQAEAEIQHLGRVLERYAVQNDGRFPEELQDLAVPDQNGAAFLESGELPVDPWGNPYVYEPPRGASEGFRISSYGADGRPGGTDAALDIDNRMIEDGDV